MTHIMMMSIYIVVVFVFLIKLSFFICTTPHVCRQRHERYGAHPTATQAIQDVKEHTNPTGEEHQCAGGSPQTIWNSCLYNEYFC
jgi:hypothetical protein